MCIWRRITVNVVNPVAIILIADNLAKLLITNGGIPFQV